MNSKLETPNSKLQDSDFRGERHVNEKTKRVAKSVREREEFMKELAEIRAKGVGQEGI